MLPRRTPRPLGSEARRRVGAAPAHCPPPTTLCAHQRAECEKLLTATAFDECLGLVPLEPYVQACMQDRCQCPPGASCVCSTISEFSRQCSHAGGRPGNWRTATLCRECRPGGVGRKGPTGHSGVIRGSAASFAGPGGGRPGVLVRSHTADDTSCLSFGCEADTKQSEPRALGGAAAPPCPLRSTGSGACLCHFSQKLPQEHGLPGEWLALHGHLLAPGGQQPVRGAPHGWLLLP